MASDWLDHNYVNVSSQGDNYIQLFDISRDGEQNIAIGFRFALDSQSV